MNPKRIYQILALLLGYGLIIAGFILLLPGLERNILILDIVVSCFIFSQFALFTVFPLINLKDSSQKSVGMLGINISTLNTTSVLSIVLMVCGILFEIPFVYQLLGQLCVLFLLFLGRIASLHAGEKVQKIHQKETVAESGKLSMKKSMQDFMDDLACVSDFDEADKKRLSDVQEALSYLTPSSNPEAVEYEQKFIQSLREISVMARNVSLNKSRISDEISRLERVLARRKSY